MKRQLASLPLILGLLFAFAFSLIPSSPALGENIPACQGSTNPSTKLVLGGRTITPTLLLQAAGGQPCPSGETSLNLVSLSHTIIVSPNSTPTQNGTTLLQAMTLISNSNPSATNPYLLKLEPGNYDLGSQSLTLLPYVDLEGSGEAITTISSTIASSSYPPANATLMAASNSEVRFVKVSNSGSSLFHLAVIIPNGTIGARFSQFTATTVGTGTSTNFAVFNAGGSINISLSNLTGSSGINSYGFFSYNAANLSQIANSTLSASGASNQNTAYYNSNGGSTISNSTLTVSGGINSYVFVMNNGISTLSNSVITASGGRSTNFGFYNTGGNSTISNSLLTSTGTSSYGLYRTGGTAQVMSSQLSGATATSTGLTVCPFSVNATTFASLTNGGPC